jgi:putative flippase GtrA
MQPTAARRSNRIERRLDGLRAHPALGRPVRFYFRRREQLLYLAVGGWNTVFGYGVWALLQYLLGDHLHYLVVVVLSWPIAVLNAYLGYRYIVFRSRGPVLRELPRFSLVYVATLLVNLALLPIALRVLPFNIYVSRRSSPAWWSSAATWATSTSASAAATAGRRRQRPSTIPLPYRRIDRCPVCRRNRECRC